MKQGLLLLFCLPEVCAGLHNGEDHHRKPLDLFCTQILHCLWIRVWGEHIFSTFNNFHIFGLLLPKKPFPSRGKGSFYAAASFVSVHQKSVSVAGMSGKYSKRSWACIAVDPNLDLFVFVGCWLKQKGADAIKFRLEQPNAMYDGHDWWMSALKVRSERMAER